MEIALSKHQLLALLHAHHPQTLRIIQMFDDPHVYFNLTTGLWKGACLKNGKEICFQNINTSTALAILNP